jgi:hypothetical protein
VYGDDKTHKKPGNLRGCDYNNSSHSDKKRTGAGGVQDRAAARWRKMVIGELAAIAFFAARAKEAAQRKSKNDTASALQLQG